MADEETQPQSIQDRIKALKLAQVGRLPGLPQGPPPAYEEASRNASAVPAVTKARPTPPPRPTLPARPATVAPVTDNTIGNKPEQASLPGASANGMDGISRPALPPRTSTQTSGPQLPPRTPSNNSSPALPPRNPSQSSAANGRRPSDLQLSRRGSNESISSIGTTRSSVSAISNGTSITSRSDRFAIRAPDFDPSSLPALPPKRTQEEKDAQAMKDSRQKATRSGSGLTSMLRKNSTPSVPVRPAARRQPSSQSHISGMVREKEVIQEVAPVLPARRAIEPPPMRKSALSMGFNNAAPKPPAVPGARPNSVPATNGGPPPIPGGRPDLAALKASKPQTGLQAPNQAPNGQFCLHCRDFSGPDNHATRFPRQSIPSQDVGWLAHQLTAPFTSATDKARAIFTWLHHNVAYDTKAFFANNVKSCTPQSTVATGLAVCQGYADTFAALALKAGLEVMVVSGASKGYGHTQLRPGEPIPPFKSTHAWNVCRIDGGEWKLIDPCWGAGNVSNQTFNKKFAPERFTQSNDDFGLDHFPTDSSQQYRNDGRLVSYEEYARGNKSGTAAMM